MKTQPQIPTTMIIDPALQLQDFQKRAKAIGDKRIALDTEINMLRQEYDKTVESLKTLGVTDLKDIPALLSQKQQELQQLIQDVESQLTEAEGVLAQLDA